MNFTQQTADAYHAATVKGAWYGPSLVELFKKIPPELAVARPAPGAHTIAELLQHLLLWNERIRNTSDTAPMPAWQADQEWAEPAIPWPELISRWNRSRDLLESHIRNFPTADLTKQVPGRTYAYEYLFPGIVQHTIYHAGQIAMLLGMLQRAPRS